MTLAEMQFVSPDLRLAGAEIFILTMACAILIIDLFAREKTHKLSYALTQLSLLGAAALTLIMSSGGQVFYTFSNMFVGDLMGDLLKMLLYITVSLVLFYSRAYQIDRPLLAKGEYYALTLFATLGMMVMISANNFVAVYIGIELLSLSLYAMVALNRDSIPATEAAMKYFVLGALASGLLLYGMSMIYGATASLDISTIAERLFSGEANKVIVVFGIVFLVSGLAFKLGVVPFHMWIPDVYHGAPTSVTLLIASAPKLAAFAIVVRVLVNGLLVAAGDWQLMLMVLAVLSMAVGNIAAIAQTNLKRMLAYSAISHMGFMLLGMVVGIAGGDGRNAINAYTSSMFYVITYVLATAGAFGTILLLARGGAESDEIADLAGLNKRSPWFAAVMMMMMFSLAGIPFFVGFFAKFSVLVAVVAVGYVWLAVAAVFFSLIGAFYYLRVVKVMYFDPPTVNTPIDAPLEMKMLMSANGLAVALLGLFPNALMFICAIALSRSLLV